MFKNNNKDTRTMSLTLPLTTLFLLLTLYISCPLFYCYKFWNQTNKCHLRLSFQVINLLSVKCEKYIVLWAGTICWATHYHPYSPKIRLQNDNSVTKFLQQSFKKSNPVRQEFQKQVCTLCLAKCNLPWGKWANWCSARKTDLY